MSSIFSKIFGDPSYSDVEDQIDKILSKIPDKNNFTTTDDSTGKIIDSFLEQSSTEEVGKLFESISVPAERLARYATYDEIFKSVPIIRRIVNVFIANIIPKNPITGECTIIKTVSKDSTDEGKKKIEDCKEFINKILLNFKLIDKYKFQILPKRLCHGNSYVEIVDVLTEGEKINLNSPEVLNETKIYSNLIKEMDSLNSNNLNNNLDFILTKVADLITEVEIVDDNLSILTELSPSDDSEMLISNDKKNKKKEDTKKIKRSLDDILLKIHKAHNIIVLETKYGSRIGYLEVMKKDDFFGQNLAQNLSQVIGKLTTMGNRNSIPQEKMMDKLISHILKKIVSKAKKVEGQNNTINTDEIVQSFDKDIYNFIKKLFVEQGIYNKNGEISKLKVRFIPSSRMIDFNTVSAEYFPYGESIFESIILPAKLYILAQLSNTVSKLSRSALIRKWTLDIGSTQMSSQMIQRLKRELYNSRITLEDLSSFKSVPKIMSDFKDLFVITKQGQTPVKI